MIEYDSDRAAVFRERLLWRVKTDVAACYQCGNCSAGCPAAFTFDYAPNQIMRMLQVGLTSEALGSSAVQLCIQCLTCTARCPRNIDVAGVFEDLKTVAVAEGIKAPEDVQVFNRVFLENIAKYGRLSEAFMLLRYNLSSGHPLNDAELGMPMVTRGKVELLPKKAAGAAEVGRIYSKAMQLAKEKAS